MHVCRSSGEVRSTTSGAVELGSGGVGKLKVGEGGLRDWLWSSQG